MCMLQLSSFLPWYKPEYRLVPTTNCACTFQSESRHTELHTGLTCMPKNKNTWEFMYWEVKINDQLISAQLRKQVAGKKVAQCSFREHNFF